MAENDKEREQLIILDKLINKVRTTKMEKRKSFVTACKVKLEFDKEYPKSNDNGQ